MTGASGYDDTIATQRSTLSVLNLLRPADVREVSKVRVGRIYDGGYVMLDDFAGIDAAYSFGIEREVSWDRQIAELDIDVYQFDHTIDAPPETHARFHWRKTGIAGARNIDSSLDTLENIVVENGHRHSDLLLKCDIEGCEYEMLAATPSELLGRFRQIVMEMHGFDRLSDRGFAKAVHDAIGNLHRTHRVVHVHANNHAEYAIMGAIPVPAVMEFTFANRARYDFTDCRTTFPTELDAPCYPHRADYYLGHFTF